jgi:uridine kinase
MIKFIIGITGGSGVGKTTLIKLLYEEFKGKVSTFSLDNYYLPKEKQKKDANGVINFDLPTALDSENLEKDINSLIRGNSIKQPIYGFNNPESTGLFHTIEPKELLIIEGLYVMYYPFLRNVLDYSVYLSVDKKLQLERRLKRDMLERNYTKEDILYQWNNHVIPSYANHVHPFKEQSNLIITNNEQFDDNIHILMDKIHQKLDQH